jgi:ribosomal protein S27AE
MADVLAPGADLAKLYGEEARCPACGAFARALPSEDHRWVCGVCGAPRVVMPEGEKLPEETAVALREAAAAQRSAALQRLASYAVGVPAGVALVLAVVLAPASFVATAALVATGLVLAVLAARASRRATTERKKLRGAVEHAWESAIGELTAKGLSPAEVGAALRIAEADVETALAAKGHVRVHVPQRVAPEAEPAAEPEAEPAAETEAEKRR